MMTIEWLGLDTAESDKKVLNENLPPNYDYRVHFFKLDKKAIHDADSQFTAKMSVRLGNCTDDGIKSFLDSFYFLHIFCAPWHEDRLMEVRIQFKLDPIPDNFQGCERKLFKIAKIRDKFQVTQRVSINLRWLRRRNSGS